MKVRTLSGLFLLVAGTAALWAAPTTAWMKEYEVGRVAADAGNWPAAKQAFQQSIAGRPEEALGVRIRNHSVPYLPHFWLGIASLETGDIVGARSALMTSESQGVIQKTIHYPELRKAMSRVEQAIRKKADDDLTSLKQTADEAVGRALEAQAAATAVGGSRNEEFQRATLRLEDAMSQTRGRADAKSYRLKASLAEQAVDLFDVAARKSQSARDAPTITVTSPSVPAPSPVALADRVAPSTPGPTSGFAESPLKQTFPDIGRVRRSLQILTARLEESARPPADRSLQGYSRSSLEQTKDWAARLGDNPSAAELAAISRQIDAVEKRLEGLRRAARPVLGTSASAVVPSSRKAVEAAYLELSRGRLQHAESLLNEIIANDGTLAEAFILRGCVRYTSAVLQAQKESLKAARSDFLTALEINPSLRLEASHFSPKLVEFFEQILKSRG